MKRRISILMACIFCMPFIFVAQKEGDTWVIGYYSGGSPDYSIVHFNFTDFNPIINWHFTEEMEISETCANICDQSGKAILWTNGMQIMGLNGNRVTDTISLDSDLEEQSYWQYYYSNNHIPFGFPKLDGAIILPIPGLLNDFQIIYHTADFHPDGYFKINQFLKARVRMNPDSSFTLIYKDELMGPKVSWYRNQVIACRHANGRDWWITTLESDHPSYYSYLLSPHGLSLDHIGDYGLSIKDGLGQAIFSSRGNFMARLDAITFDEGQYISVFEFDRCTGNYTHRYTFNTEAGYFCGVSFSPSEQYLYADNNRNLWQWDLRADDVLASQTLVDTFDGFIEPGYAGTTFAPMKLAPDGRIYISPSGAASKRFHVIDRPDLPSPDCRFLQHHLNLVTWNGRSMPNLPNYRLGPLDGSLCDTLGLNNHPIARWRFEEDQPGWIYNIRFTDLSFFDPQVWLWDFDDGTTSEEMSPVHTFEPGLYHVCLTVSNAYDSDSLCRWVEILPTGVHEEMDAQVSDLSVSPNPFGNELIIQSKSGTWRNAHIRFYDMHGRKAFDQPSLTIPSKLFLPDFAPGIYLLNITEIDGSSYSFKIMKS